MHISIWKFIHFNCEPPCKIFIELVCLCEPFFHFASSVYATYLNLYVAEHITLMCPVTDSRSFQPITFSIIFHMHTYTHTHTRLHVHTQISFYVLCIIELWCYYTKTNGRICVNTHTHTNTHAHEHLYKCTYILCLYMNSIYGYLYITFPTTIAISQLLCVHNHNTDIHTWREIDTIHGVPTLKIHCCCSSAVLCMLPLLMSLPVVILLFF